ncbi:MAG: helix-turn-helix domain-containing protein, partial [Actinomycetota bacterium]
MPKTQAHRGAAVPTSAGRTRSKPAGVLPRLSKREASILQLTAVGFSTKEIATQLGVSPQAISYHLGKLLQITGARNRTALVAMALV